MKEDLQNNAQAQHPTKKKRQLSVLLILVLCTFGVVLVVQDVIVVTQNRQSSRQTDEIRNAHISRLDDVQTLQSGVDESVGIISQYLLSGRKDLLQQNELLWKEKIWTSALALKENSSETNPATKPEASERLHQLLTELEHLERSLIDGYTAPGKAIPQISDTTDQAAILQIARKMIDTQLQQKKALAVLEEKLIPLQKDIDQEIIPLDAALDTDLQSGLEALAAKLSRTSLYIVLCSLTGLIAAVLMSVLFLRKLKIAVERPAKMLRQLSSGELLDEVTESDDELNEVIAAGKKLNSNLAAASNFAQAIGEGNFRSAYEPAGTQDRLGNALVHMRDRLQKVAEEDKRRNWTTTGLAQIGDILRKENSAAEQLYINIIRFIVKYLDANQGGLFLLNQDNDEHFLEMVACYAYERQKFLEKKIYAGEGLIGQCFVEGEAILLTEIPEKYVQITSGLGESTPRCILICPLKVNEEVSGVIELASFKVLEDFEVDFIKKLSETIASTISSVKIAKRTTLLLEETQQQAEEMRAQEEEMRQNNEELQATQEEMQRKGLEAEEQNSKLNAILDSTVDAIITIDEKGTIESINQAGLQLFGYDKAELIGKNIKMLMPMQRSHEHDGYLKNYRETGKRKVIGIPREEKGLRKDGSEFDLSLAVNEANIGGRRIFTGILRNISQQKAQEQELRQQVEDIRSKEEELRQNLEEMTTIQEELERKSEEAASQHAKMKAILDSTVDAILTIDEMGIIESVNPACEKLFGYTSEELLGQNVKILTPDAHRVQHDQYLKHYRDTGERKVIGMPREEKGRRKDGSEFPLALAVNEAKIGERRIFTGILRDITKQKEMEAELQQQLEEARATEEEIRQNMEELSAIQEEVERKNQEAEKQNSKMKAILDSTVDAILTIDEKGQIQTANPACEKLFGYQQEEMIGQNVKMLMSEVHSTHHDAYLKNYRDTGVRKIIGMPREEKGRRKDGTEFHLAIAVNEASVGDSRIFTGILRDISAQKEMEEKLQRQLEEAVASEEELRQAMEELTAIQEDLERKNRELAALSEDKKKETKKPLNTGKPGKQ